MLDFTCSVIMLRLSRSIFEGRSHEASCERGTGAAPASEGLTQPSSPGGTRAASPTTRSRPGPTTVEGIKAKMPALARREARGAPQCTSSSGAIRTPRPEQSGQCALSARQPPRFGGKEESGSRANPRAQQQNRGRYSFDSATPCSPHGAKRNAGTFGQPAPPLPDFASLHPG